MSEEAFPEMTLSRSGARRVLADKERGGIIPAKLCPKSFIGGSSLQMILIVTCLHSKGFGSQT